MKWAEKLGIRKESVYLMDIFRIPLMRFRTLLSSPVITTPCPSSNETDDEDAQENQDAESEDDDSSNVDLGGCSLSSLEDKIVFTRCKSAPAKGWWSDRDDVEEEAEAIHVGSKDIERRMLMSYAPDFFNVSPEIAEEKLPCKSVSICSQKSRSFRR